MVYRIQHEDTLNLENYQILNGIKTCGIIGFLQVTFGGVEG
jgi:hypothetical protein